MTAILLRCALLFALLSALPATAGAEQTSLRRFALIAGSNDGGASRIRLRYAVTDAIAFAKVLEELGGVPTADMVLLLDPNREEFEIGIDLLEKRLQEAAGPFRRLEVLVYYSGHSDEQGLLLNGELLPYKAFRTQLNGLSADVRIAVLDSCASGALTRSKGGRRHAPFMIDVSQKVKGHAFLTSASATEAAQESDRVGGSFFTHYLVSGLRGAADVTGDRRVTLTEAYQFAFNETLARTENTQSGPQHPNYDIQLAGSGDLVMTDLHQTSAALALPEPLRGRVFVRDDGGRLVAELFKVEGRSVELALEPGRYLVTLDDGTSLQRAVVALHKGERTEITDLEMVAVEREHVALRGSHNPEVRESIEIEDLDYEAPKPTPSKPRHEPDRVLILPAPEPEPTIDPSDYTDVGFTLTVIPGVGTSFFHQGKLRKSFSLNLLYGRTDLLDGFEIGTINHTLDGAYGVQLGAANLNDGFLEGAQLGTAFNLTLGGGYGAQLAAGANLMNGSFKGIQLSAGANLLRGARASVAQLTAGLNFSSGNTTGLQLSAGVNAVGGAGDTILQGAAGVNVVSGQLRGAQLAAGVNFANRMQGLQLSSGVNIVTRFTGAQLGIINISGDMTGAQLGVINIAAGYVSGTQIGVLNFAGDYDAGAPVGLLSFVKDGQIHLDLWASDLFIFNTSFKLGSENLYTIVHAAGSPTEGEERPGRTAFGVGLGGGFHASDSIFLAMDGSFYWADMKVLDVTGAKMFDSPKAENLVQLRLIVGYKFHEHFGLFGGISGNLYAGRNGKDQAELGRFGQHAMQVFEPQRAEGVTLRLWPGFFAGVQI